MSRPPGLSFVGIEELEGRPHVVCDGAAREGTVLTLSHWPSSPTPRRLRGDLSCEIVFSYLRRRRYWKSDAVGATNDHFDEDGLAGLFALGDPQGGFERERELVAFARAGDFGVVTRPSAAAAVFSVQGLAGELEGETNEQRSAARGARLDMAAGLYRELLSALPEVLDHPERFAKRARSEQEAYEASLRGLSSGEIDRYDDKEVDLAIFTVPEGFSAPSRLSFLHGEALPVHHFALNTATTAVRVLVAQGTRYWYYDRYETWVAFVSRRLLLRRDLGPLAARLDALEHVAGRWRADTPGSLVASLSTEGNASSLELSAVRAEIVAHLLSAPVAWDPFRAAGPLVLHREGRFRARRVGEGPRLRRSAASRSGTTGRAPFRS